MDSKFVIKKSGRKPKLPTLSTQGPRNYKELNIFRGGNLEYSTSTRSVDYILLE